MRKSVHFESFEDERICDSCYFDRLEKTIRHGLQEELSRTNYELTKARERSQVTTRELEEAKTDLAQAEVRYGEAEANALKRYRQYQEVLNRTRRESNDLEETRDRLKGDFKSLQVAILEKTQEKSYIVTELMQLSLAHENKRKTIKDHRLRLADLKNQQEALTVDIEAKSVRKHKQEEVARLRACHEALSDYQKTLLANSDEIKQQIRDEAENSEAKDEQIMKLHSQLYQGSLENSPIEDTSSVSAMKRRIVKLQHHNTAVQTSGLLTMAQELDLELLQVKQETDRLKHQLPAPPPKRSFAARFTMRERALIG